MASPSAPIVILLLLLLSVVLLTPATAQRSPCPNRCTTRRRARRSCRSRRRRLLCELSTCRRCNRRRCRTGYVCEDRASTFPPPPIPPTAVPTPPPACATRCVRRARRCFPPCVPQACLRTIGRRRRRRVSRGWQCGVVTPPIAQPPPGPNNPIVTPPAVPPVSPTPLPTPPPFPTSAAAIPPEAFIESAVQPPKSFTVTNDVERLETGQSFKVSYQVSTRSEGVVSFTQNSGRTTMECNADGSVRLRMNPAQAVLLNINDVLKIGAILVIDTEKFGPCKFGPTATPSASETEDETARREAEQESDDEQDGFLLIESVQGTLEDATIRGRPANYLTLFSTAQIRIDEEASSVSRVATDPGAPVAASDFNPVSRQSLTAGFVRLAFSSSIGVRGSATTSFLFTSANIGITASGSLVSVFIYRQVSRAVFSIDSTFGSRRTFPTRPLVSRRLSGLLVRVSPVLPPLRLRLRTPMSVFARDNINGNLRLQGNADISLASQRVTVRLSGSPFSPVPSVSTFTLAAASGRVDVNPTVTGTCTGNALIIVYPCIIVSFGRTFVYFGARLRIAATCSANTAPAFPALGGAAGGAVCRNCHETRAGTSTSLSAGQYFARYRTRRAPASAVGVFAATGVRGVDCFNPAATGVQCVSVCCNVSAGQTCLSPGNCGTGPSTSPSATATPSSVARVVVSVLGDGDDEGDSQDAGHEFALSNARKGTFWL